MRFVSASALWWLLLGGVIILFYLLKLRRKRLLVPSALLWQRALEDIEASAPFKRLRRSLLLLLQLIALAALAFALARPLVASRALASGSTIIIIDSTASMSARDEGTGSRLDRAKEIAREMVSGLSGAARAAVIESSSRVIVRSPLTSDTAALVSAINDIAETDAAGTLADALQLAEQIAKAESRASVVVVNDGGGASSPYASGAVAGAVSSPGPPVEIRFVRLGSRADNVGIVAFNSRPAWASARQEVFASIANFSDRDRQVAARLSVDRKLVDLRSLNLAAKSRAPLVFDALPAVGGLVELKIESDDDLEADNVAYMLLPDARKVRVGVMSDNTFLLQALAANPDIEARRVSSIREPDLDCVVVEGESRAELAESNRPILAVNPPNAEGLWQITGVREGPSISRFDRSHPVNLYLSYVDIHIARASRRSVAPWLKPVAADGDEGLIWAGDDGQRRVVLLGFDISESDLPLKIEFPILLANSIAWLSGRDADASDRAVRAGQPVTLRAPAPRIAVTTPTGEAVEIEAGDGTAIYADAVHVGEYFVNGSPGFAVSLLSEDESDTTPRQTIKTRAGEVGGQTQSFTSEHEVWRWIALLAVAALGVEWWVYHRRIAV